MLLSSDRSLWSQATSGPSRPRQCLVLLRFLPHAQQYLLLKAQRMTSAKPIRGLQQLLEQGEA
jgi:hypothetical protein